MPACELAGTGLGSGAGAELPLPPIEWLTTTCCSTGVVRLARVAFSVVMSLPSEFLCVASWLLSVAIPLSVRCISCSTPVSWLAAVSSCWVWALRLPDSSSRSEPCCKTTEGSPEVSTPATEVDPVSSNAAAAFWATFACAAWNWALAFLRCTCTWDSFDWAVDNCWPAWSSCSLTLSNCDVSWLTLA